MFLSTDEPGLYGPFHDRLSAHHLIADADRRDSTAEVEEVRIDLVGGQKRITHGSILQCPPRIPLIVVILFESFLHLLLEGILVERFDVSGESTVSLVDLR